MLIALQEEKQRKLDKKAGLTRTKFDLTVPPGDGDDEVDGSLSAAARRPWLAPAALQSADSLALSMHVQRIAARNDAGELATVLTAQGANALAQFRAIFRWVASHIAFDATCCMESQAAEHVLRRRGKAQTDLPAYLGVIPTSNVYRSSPRSWLNSTNARP